MHAMNEARKQRRARDTAELTMASQAAQRVHEALYHPLKRELLGMASKPPIHEVAPRVPSGEAPVSPANGSV